MSESTLTRAPVRSVARRGGRNEEIRWTASEGDMPVNFALGGCRKDSGEGCSAERRISLQRGSEERAQM